MLSRTALGHLIALAIVMSQATACTDREISGARAELAEGRQFSAQDKRIARKLSLGNNSILAETSDPTRQAALCRDALQAMEVRLASAGALNGDLLKGLQTARLYYGKRSGGSAEKTESGDEAALSSRLAESDSARTALACLQRLQDLAGA